MAVNLKAKPFYLSDDDIKWVNDTIENMTIEEKIGQLFIHMNESGHLPTYLKEMNKFQPGAARLDIYPAKRTYEEYKELQQNSKIPYLIPFNGDQGGSGACSEGTIIASSAACGATSDTETAYHTGLVAGREAAAVGINWDFGPCVDILFNWRNTIINTRSYGDDIQKVIDNSKAYIKGLRESNVAACAKHFPGDGVEELDQHLVMGINDLSCEEWDNSYGKVYKSLIDDDLQTIMIGHIALPEYSRKLRPGIKDTEIMPATLAPELLNDLLREQLGFNGLIVTDASHMAGITSAKPRKDQVPGTIAAGCDIFLYFNKPDEDFNYMMDGYKNGVISEERLQDALLRILGLKASLKLHEMHKNNTYPGEEGLSVIGCQEHLEMADMAADKSITLVKDTEQNLPIKPETHKRVKLYVLSSPPESKNAGPDPAKAMIAEELENAGFTVDVHESFYDLERTESKPENFLTAMDCGSVEEFKAKYDAVFVFVNMKGYAQENVVRLRYSTGHSNEIPWFVREVPTVCVSLNYTTHLLDLPMMKTYINAYEPTRTVVRHTIQKIMGESEFKGMHNDTVFCNRWDTRL